MLVPRVNELRYVGLAVADFARERSFFREVWGLREVSASDELAYFAAHGSSEPYVLRLRRAEATRLDVIGFAVATRADADALYAKLVGEGVKLVHEPRELASPGGGYGFRCFDCDGHTLEISADVASGPSRSLRKGESIPVRLSHVVLHAGDVAASAVFYEHKLGFRVSDWLAHIMCFLRCSTAHHRLAILPGLPNLNHIAFDVQNFDELMRGVARLANAGTPLQWGPGRHTAGSNIFSYFSSPAGVTVEYAAELEEVDEATWKPTVYPISADVTDQWGTGRLFVHAAPQLPQRPDPGLWTPPPI